jgi:23S rRNA pseudouridine2605 synthase
MKKKQYKPSAKPHAPWQVPPSPRDTGGSKEERKSARSEKATRPSRRQSGANRPDKTAAPRHRQQGAFPLPAAEVPFPLNKFLAHGGVCARRKAVTYIQEGKVTVNGKVVLTPGFKVTAKDTVYVEGKKVVLQETPVYVLLNKPKGYLTTTEDPRDRRTVMDLVARATEERIYPVGRLDRNTSGLLLFTNDGELAQQLAHPSHLIKKVYHVVLDKPLTRHDLDRIAAGLTLEDGPVQVDALAYEDPQDKTQIGIEIHSGRNRIVRRIFAHLGYDVRSLDRVLYAGLTKKNLPRGKWRHLTPQEVVWLKHFKKGR